MRAADVHIARTWSGDRIGDAVAEVAARSAEIDRLGAELEVIVTEHERSALDHLRRVCADPVVQRGLRSTLPAVADAILPWLRGGTPPGWRLRAALVRLVCRAAVKTSPLSSFLVQGAARWHDELADSGNRTALVVEPSVERLMRLRAVIAREPRLWPRLSIRLNPGLVAHTDRLVVLGPPPSGDVAEIPLTPALERALALIADRTPATTQDVASALSRRPDQGELLVRRLVEANVLEVHVPVADQDPEWPRTLLAWLRERSTDAELVAALEELAAAPATERLDECGRAVERGVHRVDRWLADQAAPRGTGAWATEEMVVSEAIAVPRAPAFHVRDDLGRLRQVLSPFDSTLPYRAALAGFHASAFTRSPVPFLVLYQELHRALRDPGHRHHIAARAVQDAAVWPGNAPPGPEWNLLRDVLAARSAAERTLRSLPCDEEEVEVPDLEPIALGGRWSLPRIAVLGQPLPEGRFAVNSVVPAQAWGASHVDRALRRAGFAGLRAEPPSDGGAALRIEVENVLGHPLNARTRTTTHVLDYPSLVSSAARDRRVPIGELIVVSDQSGLLQLRWSREDVAVEPVHTSTLSPAFLPPALHLLVHGFCADTLTLYPGRLWLRRPSADDRSDVVSHPRLVLGRLVLRRRSWSAWVDGLPRRAAGETGAHHLVRWARWLAEHGVPERCFVRAYQHDSTAASTNTTKARKPLYFDLGSPLLVRAVEDSLRGAGGIAVFTELAPDPGSADRVEEHVLLEGEVR
ncbi:lantibiotic dehydratase family protein [Lentzea sp. HUAS12]|uniref:lantibiotic dehydratase family protein n=1 Tax=Lentzea sp. HUAS12 TaxID=2951806 RepID=UPI0020A097F0|nr:lantibiotic dehydratase family protein [Lentzea sp. HUAS12]USX56354.1 lantibiotic dehydratase family protein [Lentzea sp. HUAS12]